jgi:ficolin
MFTGNADLAWLSLQTDYQMRVDLWDWEGDTRYAKYGTFSVGPASDGYRLELDGFTGNTGTY